MAIKMIVTDLDRTLLKDDKTISPYTAETLEELRRRGIPFVIATARPARAVRKQLDFLRFDGAVYFNGAVTTAGEETLDSCLISGALNIVSAILRDKPDTLVSVEMEDYLYSNMPPESLGHWGSDYCRTMDFREIAGRKVEKILISSPHVPPEGWAEEYKKYIPEELYMQVSEGTLLMVMRREATKLGGIRRLAEHFRVELSQAAAFGDDLNDIDILRACGVGVAVENALPEVKAAADAVCASNQEDGVARWIRENVLI